MKKKKEEEFTEEITKLSYEEAYGQLKEITDRLESSEIDLETMLSEYAKASMLAKHCAKLLEEAEARIRVLFEENGEIVSGEFS